MIRVWLTGWEWACCGDPFAVGDDVEFSVKSRTPDVFLIEALDRALAATVNAIESHHEEEWSERVRGRVLGVHAVTQAVVERRILRRPPATEHR